MLMCTRSECRCEARSKLRCASPARGDRSISSVCMMRVQRWTTRASGRAVRALLSPRVCPCVHAMRLWSSWSSRARATQRRRTARCAIVISQLLRTHWPRFSASCIQFEIRKSVCHTTNSDMLCLSIRPIPQRLPRDRSIGAPRASLADAAT